MYLCNKNYLGNGYGFYIDLENLNNLNNNCYNIDCYNEYYKEIYNKKSHIIEENYYLDTNITISYIIKISSTTFVTVALTYLLIFIL
jgi:hypothetical protein